MNWLIRLGHWWENRRAIRKPDYDELVNRIEELRKTHYEHMENVLNGLHALEAQDKVPPQIVRDMAILKQQMDRMELYVGLKREPQATHVQGAPKIS